MKQPGLEEMRTAARDLGSANTSCITWGGGGGGGGLQEITREYWRLLENIERLLKYTRSTLEVTELH